MTNIYSTIALGGIIIYAASLLLLLTNAKSDKGIRSAEIITLSSIVLMAVALGYLWYLFERPPMRSIGETRLWYAFFLPLVGWLTFKRWKLKWFLAYSLLMGIIFLSINLFNPEVFIKHLPPALQSAWFVPHVIVYILGYSLLAASTLIAIGNYSSNLHKWIQKQ